MSADSGERVDDDTKEVFKRADDKVDFRTVKWVHASVIFLKSECMIGYCKCTRSNVFQQSSLPECSQSPLPSSS